MATRILFSFIFLLTIACKSREHKAGNAPGKDGYTEVTVIDYSGLAGCGFIFEVNDTTRLMPESMPDSLRQHHLKVRILFKETNRPNICMVGKTISLISTRHVK